MIRTLRLAAVCLALLLVAAAAGAVTINVSAMDFSFSPASITVHPGDIVHWINNGASPHTVTSGPPAPIGRAFDVTLNPDFGQVEADPSQLRQVVMNLILNAMDAMPQGGTLTVAARGVSAGERRSGKR